MEGDDLSGMPDIGLLRARFWICCANFLALFIPLLWPFADADAQTTRTQTRLTRPQTEATRVAQQRFLAALEGFAGRHASHGSARYWAILRTNLARATPRQRTAQPAFTDAVQVTAQDRNGMTARMIARMLAGVRNNARIVGGRAVKASEFRNVVAIARGEKAYCTGTLIGRRAVLTAAHCVCGLRTALEAPDRPDEIVFGAAVPKTETARFDIIGYDLYARDFCSAASLPVAGRDLAIVHFQDNASGDARRLILAPSEAAMHDTATRPFGAILTAPLAGPSLLFAPLTLDMQLVGFGLTEKGTSGQKVHVQAAIQSLICGPGMSDAVDCKAGRETVLADQAGLGDSCRGDSGGPAFIHYGNRYFLAALTSRAIDPGGQCGAGGIYSLVAPGVVRWIVGELSVNVTVCDASGDCVVRRSGH